MKQLEGVKFAYANAERNCGLKEGDRVKILRKAATYEWGWCNNWNAMMDEAVGKFGIVLKVSDSGSGITVQVELGDNRLSIYSFPFFVLEKVEDQKLEPFQMVLVRDSESCVWTASLFSHYSDTDPNRKYVTINHAKWMYCIPYEGNEGFLGKGGDNG